jgi:hypothetical protein
MDPALTALLWTAVTIAFLHTVIGVDHYLPFIVLSRARSWSWRKLMVITGLCGVGHVASSVALGMLGVGAGVAVERLVATEEARGDIASWLLIGFGLAYAVWGLYRSLRGRPHTHLHVHDDLTVHTHEPAHLGDHGHVHEVPGRSVSTWTLFIIFVFGPCEPLIPLLIVPASQLHWGAVTLVAAVFGAITIGTMLGVVALGRLGLSLSHIAPLERFVHFFAGLAIAGGGIAVKTLGI